MESLTYLGIALLSLLTWIYLLAFRGSFWRSNQVLDSGSDCQADWPPVFAVIPARNEAVGVARSVRSLVDQDYPGLFAIILVDDASNDFTIEMAAAGAIDSERLEIVRGGPLPAGWTGKLWAASQGLDRGRELLPEAKYVLLTDADIVHDGGNLRRLVAKAEDEKLGLVSVMAKLNCQGPWERVLVPAFIFFFQKLYPFQWINDAKKRTAGAAGGCMLVNRGHLAAAGGLEAISDRIIDDCALAAAIKAQAPIWLGLSHHVHGIRPTAGLADFWRMVSRTAFVQLNYSLLALAGTVAGLILVYLVPPLGLIAGLLGGNYLLAVAGAAAWALMGVAYWPTLRFYGLRAVYFILLPVVAMIYMAMTIDSALRTLGGGGASWKGRRYAPNKLGETR